MENHPIPQDVTGFKFRLIGSVTVKQFLYLLGAGVIALVFYLIPMPFLVKLPLMLTSAGIGLSLAFVPIDGRPMDKMIMNFAKTIPAENQYIYKKHGAPMDFFFFNAPSRAQKTPANAPDNRTSQKALLFNQLSRSYFKEDPEEKTRVASLNNLFQEGQPAGQGFTNRVVNADTAVAPIPAAAAPKTAPETLSQPHVPAAQPLQAAPAAAVIPPTGGGSSADVANVLTGVVKDPRGKVLPHILVDILDQNGTPVRAFRTGQNGIFAAATPLPSGTYTIHLEDSLKKQNFTDSQIVLTGQIIPPITITSTDQREQLRRELFGADRA